MENLIIDNFSEIQIEIDSLIKDNNGNHNPDTRTTGGDSNSTIIDSNDSRNIDSVSMENEEKSKRGERVREAEDEIGF